MDNVEYKSRVYRLAEFNCSLSKGYGVKWNVNDCSGYVHKNNEIKELVGYALEFGHEVYLSNGVVYFVFGIIQISFHVPWFLSCELRELGLVNSVYEWDGVLCAWKYSESEYLKIKQAKAIELSRRKAHKSFVIGMIIEKAVAELAKEESRLKRLKSANSINECKKGIDRLAGYIEGGDYMGIAEMFRYSNKDFVVVYDELVLVCRDEYLGFGL